MKKILSAVVLGAFVFGALPAAADSEAESRAKIRAEKQKIKAEKRKIKQEKRKIRQEERRKAKEGS